MSTPRGCTALPTECAVHVELPVMLRRSGFSVLLLSFGVLFDALRTLDIGPYDQTFVRCLSRDRKEAGRDLFSARVTMQVLRLFRFHRRHSSSVLRGSAQ